MYACICPRMDSVLKSYPPPQKKTNLAFSRTGSKVRSSFYRRHGRYFEKMILALRRKISGHRKEIRKNARAKGTVRRYALPGPADSQSPCSGWGRPISTCTPSLAWRLLASLSLGSASTRRSPATSGRCWLADRWQWWPSRAPDGRELAAAT